MSALQFFAGLMMLFAIDVQLSAINGKLGRIAAALEARNRSME